ncbi:MAG: TROVE domain-containing protein [Bauldia sp.]|nr:TROVE domain-containing protein [Bauldia sp.]
MRTNLLDRIAGGVRKVTGRTTHEGAPAPAISPEAALRRSVLSCLLFEDEFYEDGEKIAARIWRLVAAVAPETVAALAIEARTAGNLRHAPLLLARALAAMASGPIVGDTIAAVIQRADEMGEFLALYWRGRRAPLDHQVKRGLRLALPKFDAYELAKYDRDAPVKLRDVLRLVHPKPKDEAQAALWKRVLDRSLDPPDTWEVALSAGARKKETFERLIGEGKLGYLALLRNLRGMAEAGVDSDLMRQAIIARRGGAQRVLPFRYIAAARACPQMEPALDEALGEAILSGPVLDGRTVVLVDVSGSMGAHLSRRSDMTRMDAAAALASVIHGDRRVFTFSDRVVEVPPRLGMAGVDAIMRSQPHGGTQLGAAVGRANRSGHHDRLIVVTDEQSADPVPNPLAKRAYMINVASNRNGVGYGRWTHIDGFSESVLRFIHRFEAENA